ncbi:MAG: Gfo/Idh/MocA family oxidoreductase [Acidovorax sp.]|nr:Gfo/Idh/MocA family oxidoreductase [Acidovorax sp.]
MPPMEPRIRIAVIGYGRFGRVHALRARAHPSFDVQCVVDPCPMAREAARADGFRAVASLDALPPNLDAASIVTPAETHAEAAIALMRRGIDVLVEKPMATSEAEIGTMLDTAQATRCKLFTGHIERFNQALATVPWDRAPASIVFSRQSRLPGSSRSVVLDLMVHDLDLAAHLLRCHAPDAFQILAVQKHEAGVFAQAAMGTAVVDFHVQHGADSSCATLSWQLAEEAAATCQLPLSHRPGPEQPDALTRQYTAFHHVLTGQASDLASAIEGATAVRRALAIAARL